MFSFCRSFYLLLLFAMQPLKLDMGFHYLKICRLTQNYSIISSPWPWVVAGFAYYVIQRNDTTNGSIFHMSDGMQGVYNSDSFYLLFCFLIVNFSICSFFVDYVVPMDTMFLFR